MGEWVGGGGLHKASGCYPQPAGMPGPGCRASLDTGGTRGGRRERTVTVNRLQTLNQSCVSPLSSFRWHFLQLVNVR